jgi:flagellar hook-associated protein 2
VTLSASLDSEAVTDTVRTFVNEVNTVLRLIQDQTRVTTVGEKTSGSILTGNYGVQMIQQRIKNVLAQKGLGFDYDLDPLVSLASVGISTDSSEGSPMFGLLTFDEQIFSAALLDNPDAVARIFSADYVPSAKEMVNGQAAEARNFKVDSFIRGVTQPGSFDIQYTIFGGTIASATINGYPASIDGNRIIASGGENPARGMSIEVIRLTDGAYAGQVYLKAGKAEELSLELKKLTDPMSGTLEILKDNYQDIMDAIDDKISYEERRLALLEKTMRQRFANLEAVLGRYDKLSNQLQSQINSLGSKSK